MNPQDNDQGLPQLLGMAAVRRTFKPEKLLDQWMEQYPDASPQEMRMATDTIFDLEEMSVPMMTPNGEAALTLPDERRLPILASLGAAAALRMIGAIPSKEVTATERMLASVLETGAADIDDDYAQLSTMQSVSSWATALGVASAIAPEEAGARLRRHNFIHALGGPDLPRFVGRHLILDRLADAWAGTHGDLSCVAIEGPGGTGKSLTVTRFIADMLAQDDVLRPDAVYHLDFDRVHLQQAQPATIWRELIRQSSAWCPPESLDALEELALELGSDARSVPEASEVSRESRSHDETGIGAKMLNLIRPGGQHRIIVFVDSIEQVEGYDDVAAESPLKVACTLGEMGVSTLLVCASRTFRRATLEQMDRFKLIRLKIGQFDVDEAIEYLMREAERAGVAITREEAHAVQVVAGRSPLALRLAVALLEKGDRMGGAVAWHQQVEDAPEFVQAALYERLLRRIRNEELRKIAAPGLLVRRLTADVIREVLAQPCRLDLVSCPEDRLMAAARQEGQLFDVREDDPGALWHRPDVRATMLDNVRRLAPEELAREIHSRAIAFYETRAREPVARIEELYHRLCLDQPADVLDRRWSRSAGLALRPCLNEFPPAAQSYIRARFGAATSVDRADGEAEYRLLSRKRLRSNYGIDDLLASWDEEGRRLDGSHGDLYAAALVNAGRHEEMLEGAAKLIEVPDYRFGDPQSAAGVFRIAAAVLEGRMRLGEAHRYWRRAVQLCEHAREPGDMLASLSSLVGLVRVTRKQTGDENAAYWEQHSLMRVVERSLRELYGHNVLAREIAAEMGKKSNAARDRAIISLIEDVISSNEAFPSRGHSPERMGELSERFLGTRENMSTRNINSAATRGLHSNRGQLGLLVDTLREEVDWTLARGAGLDAPS